MGLKKIVTKPNNSPAIPISVVSIMGQFDGEEEKNAFIPIPHPYSRAILFRISNSDRKYSAPGLKTRYMITIAVLMLC
jgi:hypothetical protein